MTLNDDFEIVEPDLADAELRRIEFSANRILLAFALAGGSESFVLEVVEPLWLNCSTDFPQNVVDRVAIFEDLRAVEETLRASRKGGGGTIPRYARTDLDIDGVKITAGQLVLLDVAAANQDPAAYLDPERVDVTRSGPPHLSFGYGPRYCIGAPLARIELQVVLSHLASRFPTLRLTVGVEELTMRADVLVGGLTELPVRW